MNEAKISDIFMSYQGEGPYVGVKQLFTRFHGCSINCIYCDTKPASFNVFTKEELLYRILEFQESYHSTSITGGEPLEQINFLEDFLPLLKRTIPKDIYLETNGILYKELKRIIDNVDVIAMDIKLPSSTGRDVFWHEHKRFLEIAKTKNVFVKIVITDRTDFNDIIKAKDIVKSVNRKIPFVLQPVDPIDGIREPLPEVLIKFKNELDRDIEDVRIIPQWHKKVGIK